MGMFDTLVIDCPECYEQVEIQSKAGRCCMDTYNIYTVPDEILLSLRDKHIVCEKCGHIVTISFNRVINLL